MPGGRPRKINGQDEIGIFRAKRDGFKTEELAVKYGVSASTIMRIIRKQKNLDK